MNNTTDLTATTITDNDIATTDNDTTITDNDDITTPIYDEIITINNITTTTNNNHGALTPVSQIFTNTLSNEVVDNDVAKLIREAHCVHNQCLHEKRRWTLSLDESCINGTLLKDGARETPLLAACESDNYEMVEVLLEAKALVNGPPNTCPPLAWAVSKGSMNAIRILIDHNADVNMFNNQDEQCTPLSLTTKLAKMQRDGMNVDCVKVAQWLLNANADVNLSDARGRTPLHIAVSTDCEGIVFLLLRCGANVHAQDDSGFTPLHNAMTFRRMRCVSTLVEAGALACTQDNRHRTAYRVSQVESHQQYLSQCVKERDIQSMLMLVSLFELGTNDTHGNLRGQPLAKRRKLNVSKVRPPLFHSTGHGLFDVHLVQEIFKYMQDT